MCNRYGYVSTLTTLQHACSHLAHVKWDGLEPAGRFAAITPGNLAPIVRQVRWNLEIAMLRWGMPIGARDGAQTEDELLSCASADGIAGHEVFGAAYAARRCLVPATCYYAFAPEGDWPARRRPTVTLTVPGHPIFAFPGVWRRVETPDGPVESFALVTCDAPPELAPYGERTPVILPRPQWGDWLDPNNDMIVALERPRASQLAVLPAEKVA